jgi:hypothetical protein
MAVRDGMVENVDELRRLTSAGTAEYTAGTVVYWTDEQLQDVLDNYRNTWKQFQLQGIQQDSGGTAIYLEYPLSSLLGPRFERDATNSGWVLQDVAGSAVPANTINYNARMITFDEDTGNETFYLDCRTYDINRAAAEVWETKATQVASRADWRSDNHQVWAAKLYDHYMQQADHFRGRGFGGNVAKMVRTDER